MAEEPSVSRAVVARATARPQAAGARLHWDGRSGVRRKVGPLTCSGSVPRSSFLRACLSTPPGWRPTSMQSGAGWRTGWRMRSSC
jgi:hypothetical protein